MAQGDASFADGNVSVARFYYEQAVDAGDAEGAVRMGETFDPAYLTLGRPRQVFANREASRFWYRRALDLGVTQAKQRLDNLEMEQVAGGYTDKDRASATRRYDRPSFHKLLERILYIPEKLTNTMAKIVRRSPPRHR
jgi:TPR repeat protein